MSFFSSTGPAALSLHEPVQLLFLALVQIVKKLIVQTTSFPKCSF
jgi:hypothetical protein